MFGLSKHTLQKIVVGLLLLLCAATAAHADTLWDHNGSTMRLVAEGANRFFYYVSPRQVMADQGVVDGTLFFNGRRSGNSYIGTARVFSNKCSGPLEFRISGTVLNEHLIVLEGDRPVFENCSTTGATRHEKLVFSYISMVPETRVAEPVPDPEPPAPPPVIAPAPKPIVPVVDPAPAPQPPVVLPMGGTRVALVIGNGAYQHANALPNPSNDADAMAALLARLGFTVVLGTDLDKQQLEQKIREFVRDSKTADLALFFYAGHALQVAGENFIVPVDAVVEDETALDFELVNVKSVTNYMGGEKQVGVVLLDACRDNPFTRSLARSLRATRAATVNQGLAAISTEGGGLLVAYATAPGDVALDGDGDHSPFTAALLRNLPTPGMELEQIMKRVKNDVAAATKQDQRPWTNSDLTTEVYLMASDK